jgi:UPF0716 family protein affecting phage T7 exclusion
MGLRDHLDELEPSGLIIIGAILVLIPEPATSTFGLGLVLLGIVWLVREWR